jgi:hypothetical protein
MLTYPAYDTQALQWQSLQPALTSSTSTSLNTNTNTNTTAPPPDEAELSSLSQPLSAARENIQQALHEHEWLLQEHQHLVVPPTHLDEYIMDPGRRIFSMGDFCHRADRARDLDVQKCAFDDDNEVTGSHRRPLTDQQYQELRQTGELTVPSVLFENQHHIWKVAPSFYSGSRSIRDSLGKGVGKALDHAVVYTADAVFGNPTNVNDPPNLQRFPNFRNAVTHGLGGAARLFRQAAGQLFAGRLKHSTYSKQEVDGILSEAERSYCQRTLERNGHDTRRLYDRASTARTQQDVDKLWDILEADAEWGEEYRPSSEDCRAEEKASNELIEIRSKFERTEGPMRSDRLEIDQTASEKSPKAAVKELRRAKKSWEQTRKKAWIEHLKNIASDGTKELAAIETDRLTALDIEQDVEREDQEKIQKELKEYGEFLQKKHPIMALSNAWTKHKLDTKRERTTRSYESTRLGRVAHRLEEVKALHVQGSARKLAFQFRGSIREDLARRLRSKQSSFPPAKFEVLQLNPNNWGGNGFKKCKEVEVDLGKPFWRVRYSWMMFVTLTKSIVGGSFHFLTAGPLSLRALLSPNSYYAIERPVRDPSSLTSSLASRLTSFHRALKDARDRFESTPDRGLIGKSVQRFFLRNSLAVKGTVGSVCIVAFMTIGTAVATVASTVGLLIAPIVATIVTGATMLFNVAFYDTAVAAARNRFRGRRGKLWFGGEPPMPSRVSPLLKIGIGAPYCLLVPGTLQAVLAATRMVVVHPVASMAHFLWTFSSFVVRSLRDSVTWLFIRKYSRVPATDTFLAWRIHGPGLASTQYYRMPVEAAKASVLLLLDKYRLVAHEEVRKAELEAPYDSYRALFTSLMRPFGIGVVMSVPTPSSIAFRVASAVERPKTKAQRQKLEGSTRPKMHEHVLDIWDVVAEGIRSSDPGYRLAQDAHTSIRWDVVTTKQLPDSELDKSIRSDVDAKYEKDVDAKYEEHKSQGKTELDEMVNRAGKLLAEWNLQMAFRKQRLTHAVSIPTSAIGRFRMSHAEQQELWKFTLQTVDTYGQELKQELEGILLASEFSNELKTTVKRIAESFYTQSGARPGKDIALVAAFVLRQLLGGEDMLGTLEETDETLMLSPKISKEDEHLVFWRSFV